LDKSAVLGTLDRLANNAMFAVSMTSKELFHTNFWAWLLRKYPQIFTPVFYPEYNGIDNVEVLREKQHFDLSVKIGNKTLIIENKMKSVPDVKQLEKYSEKIKGTDNSLILISYYVPLFFHNQEEMQEEFRYPTFLHKTSLIGICDEILSYSVLHKRMKTCYKKAKLSLISDVDKAIIESYLEFLGLLNELQDNIMLNDNDKIGELWDIIKDKEVQDKLEQINFTKTFERIFIILLTKKVLESFAYREYLDDVKIDCGMDLKIYSDMLFYFPGAWDEDETKRQDLCFLGISLWENEYRYYAGLHKKQCGITAPKNGRLDKENKIAGFKYLTDNYGWFFNQEDNCHWNGYSYDKEMYLYKKLDISDLTVKELVEKAVQDLEDIYFYKRDVRCQD